MRILAFDTATRATTVAISDESGELEIRDDPARGQRPTHTTRLMALIVEAMRAGSVGWSEIDRIAVGVGPGTFTGLRVGVASARALARARRIPLVGISTLRSLALGAAASDHNADVVVGVLDARRGEVFAAAWRRDGVVGEAMLGPVALAPEQLAESIAREGSAPLAIGEGAVEFRTILERSGALIPADGSQLHRVNAINHCRLAGGLRPGTPDQIGPEYLRLPDAEIARRQAGNQ
jgi:tRNA threonylcarbamoyladenosine biosynthesis protein TsaB